MRTQLNRIVSVIFLYLILYCNTSHAQQKFNQIKRSKPDTLLVVVNNFIYNTYYNFDYWKKSIIPVFTVLKAEIDETGKLKSLNFSDSADSLFTNALWKSPTLKNLKASLQTFVKKERYKTTSILIPVSYEPNYNPTHDLDYQHAEAFLRFGNKYFIGPAILLAPVRIKVLSKGNL